MFVSLDAAWPRFSDRSSNVTLRPPEGLVALATISAFSGFEFVSAAFGRLAKADPAGLGVKSVFADRQVSDAYGNAVMCNTAAVR